MNLFNWFKKPDKKIKNTKKRLLWVPQKKNTLSRANILSNAYAHTFQKQIDTFIAAPYAMDSALYENIGMDNASFKTQFFQNSIPDNLITWYASQGFIGYQLCALLSQNWLIGKACSMPAEDAIRKGYEITINNGNKNIDPEIINAIAQADIKYKVAANLKEFIRNGRIFGIRIAMFIIEGQSDEFYYKPFNIDAVKPGTYKGISQIDPYWVLPQLDNEASGNPASIYFYEPTWWQISGRLIHRSHLIIYRTENPPDILKPTYLFGGIPLTQKIYDLVYNAQRTANEAPLLCLTKRLNIVKTDMSQAIMNQESFEQKMQWISEVRNNYGVFAIDTTEEVAQIDTSLAELDNVIMTQYQIVAAAAETPASKLLGTPPKGFNSTGEFEEANYHEFLESLQSTAATPLVQRHHELLIKSEIAPRFGMELFETEIIWRKLDAMTEQEKVQINKGKAEIAVLESQLGAIDGIDERQRLINDPDSGYNGMEMKEINTEEENEETNENEEE